MQSVFPGTYYGFPSPLQTHLFFMAQTANIKNLIQTKYLNLSGSPYHSKPSFLLLPALSASYLQGTYFACVPLFSKICVPRSSSPLRAQDQTDFFGSGARFKVPWAPPLLVICFPQPGTSSACKSACSLCCSLLTCT